MFHHRNGCGAHTSVSNSVITRFALEMLSNYLWWCCFVFVLVFVFVHTQAYPTSYHKICTGKSSPKYLWSCWFVLSQDSHWNSSICGGAVLSLEVGMYPSIGGWEPIKGKQVRLLFLVSKQLHRPKQFEAPISWCPQIVPAQRSSLVDHMLVSVRG